jgi:hypothetical protein
MTPRERALAVINETGKPDRLPWLPELNDGFIRKVVEAEGPAPQGVDPQTFVNLQIGADQLARVVSVKQTFRRVEIEQRTDEGMTIWHTPAGDLVERAVQDPVAKTSYRIRHRLDGEGAFAAYHALLDDLRYEPDYEKARAQFAKVGDTGLVTVDAPATPLQHIIMWDLNVQDALMAMYDRTGEMVDLMRHMHEKNLEYYRVAAAGPGEVVRPMEDTSSMLTGPAMYAEHCAAYLSEYGRIVHEHGKKFIVHMCGHLKDMLPIIKDIELDGIEAATPGPTGNVEPTDIRRVLGDVIIMGGVDPSRYAIQPPQEMVKTIKDRLNRIKGDRHFILGHEEIPVAANIETVKAVGQLVAETADGFYSN